MATVNFYLKEPKSQTDTPIYLVFRYDGQTVKISTGEKINPKFWNGAKGRASQNKQFPQFPEFNANLQRLENGVLNMYRAFKNDGQTPTPPTLQTEFKNFIKGNAKKENPNFFEFFNMFINEAKGNKSKAIIIAYNQTLRRLQEFERAKKMKLDYNSFTLEFYNLFYQYLNGLNLATNTMDGYVKVLKTVLYSATERGYNTCLDFQKRGFKRREATTTNIYLNETELRQLLKLDLSNNKRLERVRDLFIIGCYTGLRFSDFSLLKKGNIQDGVIKVVQEKTKDEVIIPIHPIVKRIIARYDGNAPRPMSNQKMNVYLKELGKLAGFDQPVTKTIIRGNTSDRTETVKYELITTHTARRSFATNAYLSGYPTYEIMKITGHKTEKNFQKYIKVSQHERAKIALEHPFFKDTNPDTGE